MNPEVDEHLSQVKRWQAEFECLRLIILDHDLTERLKWGNPCYSYQAKNILLLHGFKEYCALLFFKGALLKDPRHILIAQTENSQSSRQLRFRNTEEILELAPTIKAYIDEAIEVAKSGQKVDFKQSSDFKQPDELLAKFAELPDLKQAFEALTPGRQKAYLLHFSAARQSQTRTARIERYTARILTGKGLRDCVCGHSKKMPACDGSHKYLPAHQLPADLR